MPESLSISRRIELVSEGMEAAHNNLKMGCEFISAYQMAKHKSQMLDWQFEERDAYQEGAQLIFKHVRNVVVDAHGIIETVNYW